MTTDRVAACGQLWDKISSATQVVNLLPVSKGQNLGAVHKLWITFPELPKRLGENYLEEFLAKKNEVIQAGENAVEWHFLGRPQSRKLKELAEHADYLHGISRLKELDFLSSAPKCPRFFIQVNISSEEQKNGADESEVPRLVEAVYRLNLQKHFAGFMGMAAPLEDAGEKAVRVSFQKLRHLRDQLAPGLELSMGMSADYEIAIEEGSNWLRIGTLLFGDRKRLTA